MLTRSVRYASAIDPRLRTRVAAQRRPSVQRPPAARVPGLPELPAELDHGGDPVRGLGFACLFGTVFWVVIGAAVCVF